MIKVFLFLLILAMPAIPADLKKAIDDLDNNKYYLRTAATRKLLTSKDEDVIPLLVERFKNGSSEARYRARMILEYQWDKIIGLDRDWPSILCLPKDYKNRQEVIFKYKIEQENDYEDTYFIEENEATRALVFDLLRKDVKKEQILEMLEIMWENEKVWNSSESIKMRGRRYYDTPPLEQFK